MCRLVIVVLLAGLLFAANVFAGDYLIGKGDVLEVAVWGVPEMSRSVVVRPDGKITLPAIGDVNRLSQTPPSSTVPPLRRLFDPIATN